MAAIAAPTTGSSRTSCATPTSGCSKARAWPARSSDSRLLPPCRGPDDPRRRGHRDARRPAREHRRVLRPRARVQAEELTSLFEPAVIIFMGMIVGFVAMALISAMYGVYPGRKNPLISGPGRSGHSGRCRTGRKERWQSRQPRPVHDPVRPTKGNRTMLQHIRASEKWGEKNFAREGLHAGRAHRGGHGPGHPCRGGRVLGDQREHQRGSRARARPMPQRSVPRSRRTRRRTARPRSRR